MEKILNFVSLLIASASFITSVVALRISKNVLKYTSREYLPDLNWDIDDSDVLNVKNKSNKLFQILQVGLLKINYFGYEDQEKRVTVQLPLITVSRMRSDLQNEDKITVSKETAFACAYVCPYDEQKVAFVKDRISSFVNQRGTKSYLPSLQSVTYLIEIVYVNAFKENKTLHLMKRHIHGTGYNHSLISEEKFLEIAQRADIPKFNNNDEFWDYVTNKFSQSWGA